MHKLVNVPAVLGVHANEADASQRPVVRGPRARVRGSTSADSRRQDLSPRVFRRQRKVKPVPRFRAPCQNSFIGADLPLRAR